MLIGIDASRANEEQKTGVGWYAWHLIQELKHLTTLSPDHLTTTPLNHTTTRQPVRVVLYSNKPLVGELANLPEGWSEKVLSWPLSRFWTQMRMSWEMLINPPDVLFIPSHVFPIIHPKKTVMTIHDIGASKFPESYSWFSRWYTLWSAKYAIKNLWKVIVPSEFTKRELCEEYKVESRKENVVVVPLGYDKRYEIKYDQNINKILEKYKIEKPYLLSIGRLEEKKNTRRIVLAFDRLRKQLPITNYQLLLIGNPGYGYEDVKNAIENSPFKKDIITPGWVDDNDLPILMSGAEVFVFPSLYEGFGIPVLEAMASGVPVIASKVNSSQEVGGDACLCVDPNNVDEIADGILKLMQNAELRMRNVEKGLERVKMFSWKKCAEETLRHLNT